MIPPLAPTFALGWFDTKYLLWTAVFLATLMVLAIAGFILRKHRAAVVALIRHPFAKYVMLSIAAHVALAVWLVTSHWFEVAALPPGAAVVVVDVGSDEDPPFDDPTQPWDQPSTAVASGPVPKLPEQEAELPPMERPEVLPASDNRVESPLANLDSLVQNNPVPPSPFADAPKPLVELRSDAMAEDEEPVPDRPNEQQPTFSPGDQQQLATLDEQPNTTNDVATLAGDIDEPIVQDSPPEEKQPETNPTVPMQVVETVPKAKLQPRLQPVSSSRALQSSTKRRADGRPLPVIYRDRWVGDRLAIARTRGGSEDTEACVRAALVWLAQAQGADGRWDASQYGSGQPIREGGHDRGNAGVNADTATTGLALLAFLGSGHTHTEGEYSETVRFGIEFLVRAQQSRTDGSLVGEATGYAAMYCHGIATLALGEAYSLTGDESLRRPLSHAINFTLAAQHPGGGWRYRPQEPGDTSQLGWQLMALTSAHYAGFSKTIARHPSKTWTSASQFLDSVAWGSNGGRASYKPNSRPTTAMTAEALLCRLLLNTPTDHPRILEAADHLMAELPGQGRLNYYYWYYGTLGLFHLQDDHWRRWNGAITRQLTTLQRQDGSWPTENSVWGNAGGTVYTTALAAMTLEVYYRYRPFSETHRVDRTARRN